MGLVVAGLWAYPVKGLRGIPLDTVLVEPWGFENDRRWMVVDEAGRALTQRECPRLATLAATPVTGGLALSADASPGLHLTDDGSRPRTTVQVWGDEVPAADCGDEAARWLRERLSLPCRLAHMDQARARPVDHRYGRPGDCVSFADGYPVQLTSDTSLAALNGRLQHRVGMERFRPNLVVSGAAAWAEDGWRDVRVGPVVFRAVKRCSRCIVVTVDQRSGERPDRTEPLRTLGMMRRDDQGRITFGQNLIPDTTGVIRIGDPVEAG